MEAGNSLFGSVGSGCSGAARLKQGRRMSVSRVGQTVGSCCFVVAPVWQDEDGSEALGGLRVVVAAVGQVHV